MDSQSGNIGNIDKIKVENRIASPDKAKYKILTRVHIVHFAILKDKLRINTLYVI